MRCLRAITDEQLTATVFLSKEDFDTLDDELHKNFNMEIKDIKNPTNTDRQKYKVRVLPPPKNDYAQAGLARIFFTRERI